jgi:hypothetical protein
VEEGDWTSEREEQRTLVDGEVMWVWEGDEGTQPGDLEQEPVRWLDQESGRGTDGIEVTAERACESRRGVESRGRV